MTENTEKSTKIGRPVPLKLHSFHFCGVGNGDGLMTMDAKYTAIWLFRFGNHFYLELGKPCGKPGSTRASNECPQWFEATIGWKSDLVDAHPKQQPGPTG